MWAAQAKRVRETTHNAFKDCLVVLDPDGDAHSCTGIFDAPYEEVVPDDEGGVGLCSIDPTVTVDLALLGATPKTRDILTVRVQNADGTYEAAVRYRVKETQPDGYGSMTMPLGRGGS